MRAHDGAADSEPKSSAGGFRRTEWIEHTADNLVVDSGTVVTDRDFNLVVGSAARAHDHFPGVLPSGCKCLERIANEVENDLLDLPAI